MDLNNSNLLNFFKNKQTVDTYRLCDLLNQRNNLNLIRLVAASLVTFSHSFVLSGRQGDPLEKVTGLLSFGSLAVWIFFFISGLLVSRSYDKGKPISYIFARILRIYPGLIVACIFTALCIGPISTNLSVSDYISNKAVYEFIKQNLLFNTVFVLPGVFQSNPYPNSVNGSLWTLRYEVYMYICVFGIGLMGWLKERHVFNVFIILAVLLYLKNPAGFLLVSGELNNETLIAIFSFALGAMAYVNRHVIYLSLIRILLLLLSLLLFLKETFFVNLIFILVVIDIIIYLGFNPRLQFNKLQINNDYSYGIYIYSFPIQQLIAMHYIKLTPIEHFVTAYSITFALAIASWHMIEKPVLRFKSLTRKLE